jgi:hypothetical protein
MIDREETCMAYTDWRIKTKRLSTCSCDYGCPCEFNARPTRGVCEGTEALEITEGYFGNIRLDGLRVAGRYRWPGAVHEGHGAYQVVIDQRATPEQTEALFTIFSGKEQEPTTAFSIYATTIEHDLDPLFAHIEFEWDLKNRTGRMEVAGVLGATIQPIRNPVTGAAHRALIKLPQGFEFREAEMASSTFWSVGTLPQNYQNCYGFLTFVTYGPQGVIEDHSYPLNEG